MQFDIVVINRDNVIRISWPKKCGGEPMNLNHLVRWSSLAISLVLCLAAESTATTYFVSANSGNDLGSGLSWSDAKFTIQAAVDAASSNDTILVSNGVYNTGSRLSPGQVYCKSRVVINKPLNVESVNGPEATFIAGEGPLGTNAVRCVWMTDGVVLSGFTLTNGFTTALGPGFNSDGEGGGVFALSTNSLITNCIFVGNSAETGGGVSRGTLRNCILIANYGEYAGGASLGVLRDCVISNNAALYGGGGASRCDLYNCLISRNNADGGGGTYFGTLNNCTLIGNSVTNTLRNTRLGGGAYFSTLSNCTVVGNSAKDGGGAHSATLVNCIITGNVAYGLGGGSRGSTLKNCVLTGNSGTGGGANGGTLINCTLSGNTSGFAGGTARNTISYGNSNYQFSTVTASFSFTNDPFFVDTGSGNFRLQSNSPCINSGSNTFAPTNNTPYDLDGFARITGGIVDMGAYEFRPETGTGTTHALSFLVNNSITNVEAYCGESIPVPLVRAYTTCQNQPADNSLVLRYSFNADGPIVDSSVYNRTSTNFNASWLADGKFGGCMRFNGTNSFIQTTDAGLPAGDSPRTISMWISFDELHGSGGTDFISYGTRAINQYCYLAVDWRNNRDQFAFSQWGAVVLSTTKVTTVSNWINIAHVYGGNNEHQWFVDGVACTGIKETFGPINTTLSGIFQLGSQTFGEHSFSGLIDEVRIYNRALTGSEISAVLENKNSVDVGFNETVDGSCPSAITRIWTASDGCGNSVGATQIISLVEGNPITLTGVPADTNAPCADIPDAPSVTVSGSCITPPATNGLLLHYTFDNPANVGLDSSGVGHHGTANGPVYIPDGYMDGACQFTGGGEINVDEFSEISGTTQLTWGAWIKPDPGSGLFGIFGKTTSLNESFYLMLNRSANFITSYVVPQDRSEERTANANTAGQSGWYHVMATYDGVVVKMYLNGALVDIQNYTTVEGIRSNALKLAIGDIGSQHGWRYRGLIDEVKIYGRVLSDLEVDSLYRQQSGTQVTMTETTNGPCPKIIKRVWSAQSLCGSSVSATQYITLVDTESPVFAGVPVDASVNCAATLPPPAEVTAWDECEGAVSVSLDEQTSGDCPGTVTRIWTAVDACGNSSSATQVISRVEGNTIYMIGVPPDEEISCGSISYPDVSATGGCITVESAFSDGLVLYYPFDGSGAIVDASGMGHMGTSYDADWTSEGKLGGAYRFDGTNDHILTSDSGLPAGDSPRTISMWLANDAVYSNDGTDFISYGTQSINNFNYLAIDWRVGRKQFAFSQWGAVVLSTSRVTTVSNWIHIAHVYGGTNNHKWYVNGVEGTGLKETHGPVNTILSGTLRLGSQSFSVNKFRGKIDEVRIYNRALSASEITGVMSNRLNVFINLQESTNGTCPKVITRVWAAEDDCGNIGVATQVVTVVDTTPPVLSGVPSGITISCDDPMPTATVTALDACSGALSVTYNEQSVGTCPATVTRTWSAVDTCGNAVGATQIINKVETSGLWLSGVPLDVTLPCGVKPLVPAVSAAGACEATEPPVTNGLILHYTFDDAGNLGHNSSGAGHHGTASGGPIFATNGYAGGAARFNGSGQITVDTFSEISLTTQMTWGAWVKPEAASGLLGVMGKTLSGNESFYLLANKNANFASAYVVTPGRTEERGAQTANVLQTGVWQHVMSSYDGRTVKMYLNGNLVGSNTYGSVQGMRSNSLTLVIGDVGPNFGWRFQGLIDDARIYLRVLNAEEVAGIAAGAASSPVTLTMTESTNGVCPKVVNRVWTAVDSCDQTVAATQKITWVDSIAPVLYGVPEDTTSYCGDIPAVPVVTASDDCSGTTNVFMSQYVSTGCPAVVTRTWTAEDGCGNSTSATQVIYLSEDTRDTDGDGLTDIRENELGTDPVKADSDDDGLTDWEEVTGLDDTNTSCKPNGMITNPLAADTDGDGSNDCEESYVGTDPNADDGGLILDAKVLHEKHDIIVCWPSVSNRTYSIVTKTDLMNPVFPVAIATNILATPPENCHTSPIPGSFHMFIRVRVD
jgi:Concanavalin A-like lectin/glucanases superfamily/Bacterial TSP3 repeat